MFVHVESKRSFLEENVATLSDSSCKFTSHGGASYHVSLFMEIRSTKGVVTTINDGSNLPFKPLMIRTVDSNYTLCPLKP